MVLVAGSAAAGAAGALFGYNRENFMEDREQRMTMEFALRKFRVTQANLWREDVRAFVSLTERKMSIYLLVNVLMLGFTLNLWCEGRLPETTPGWLVMGNQIAIAGSFAFLLLTVWLAVHAAVAAQSYQTRILTQLVRLPVPTWEELEACRTYASDFEKVETRQMLRVPFLQGQQERLVRPAATASSSSASSREMEATPHSPGVSTVCGQAEACAVAADPWGLERDGEDSIYELGCHQGAEVAGLRHIKLLRQAAVYWQTYDAFARVSMSLGVCQLMLAMSYYILGYVLTQAHAPVPAFAGVVVLMGSAEVVARVDLTLPVGEQRLVQALMLFGPSISCVATYLYAQHEDLPARIAESLTPIAFLSHGAVVCLLTLALRVREQENGAMLPLAYQGVLYLDVFGWVSHKSKGATGAPSPLSSGSSRAWLQDATPPGRPKEKQRRWGFPFSKLCRAKKDGSTTSNYFAADYSAEFEEDEESLPTERPSAMMVSKAPTRPEDALKPGSAEDYRHEPEAPRMWEQVNAVQPPAKEFWDAATFMPADCRQRQPVDDLFAELPGFSNPSEKGKDLEMVTGHDDEAPGVLPWRVVRMAAVITSLVWIAAGFHCTLQVTHIWRRHLPWWWEIPALEGVGDDAADDWKGPPPELPWKPHRLAFLQHASLKKNEHLLATFPSVNFKPKALACDAVGRTFLVTDGLSAFSATPRHGARTVFTKLPACATAAAVTDVALLCPSASSCEALLLSKKRLTSCPLAGGKGGSFAMTRKWLKHGERPSSLLVEPGCTTPGLAGGCVWLGTTQGRAVRLRASADGKQLVPAEEKKAGAGGPLRWAKNGEFAELWQGGALELSGKQALLELPSGETPKAFCTGGDFAFFLGGKADGNLWRRPLPKGAAPLKG